MEEEVPEVELARLALEEKAEQLALSSKYKSEFLANMSHELRTPLNSLLILSQLLADNPDGNLEAKQVEFATTIHSAGADLLTLLNDILDLAKIESDTMTVEVDELAARRLREDVQRNFGHSPSAQGAGVLRRARRRRCRASIRPIRSACGRCSRTCSPTPSSSPSAARWRSASRRRPPAGARPSNLARAEP